MKLIPNKQIILNNFNIISYDISYCYNTPPLPNNNVYYPTQKQSQTI